MPVQLKIVHKGLALVLIPFLVNGIWILLLLGALDKTAKLVELEQHQSETLEHLNMATQLLMAGTGSLGSYLMTKNEIYKRRTEVTLGLIRDEIEWIGRQPSTSPEQRSSDMKLLTAMEDQVKSMEADLEATNSTLDLNDFSKVQQLAKLVNPAFKRGAQLLIQFDERNERLTSLRQQSKSSRAAVTDLVIKGLAVNLIMALALAALFISDICRRLQVLVENARKLPKRLPLAPPIGGTDELSYLDDAMRTASADLQAAFEFRTSLMQMVAHDLRSPLQASQISLSILADFEAESMTPSAVGHVGKISANNRRVLALINDLLTVDALEMGQLDIKIENTSLRTVAEESIATLSELAAAKKITLLNSITDDTVLAQKDRLIQVLLNYLSNAIKFSPRTSTIELTSEREGNLVTVSVRDEGPGLSSEDAEHVFDKYFQAREGKNAEGFGLGLAICRLIIESHGGQVGVISAPGNGAKFWFSVRAAEPAEVPQSV